MEGHGACARVASGPVVEHKVHVDTRGDHAASASPQISAAIACARSAGNIGCSYADPRGTSRRREDAMKHCRGGSTAQTPTLAGVALEKTPNCAADRCAASPREGSK